MKNNLQTFHSYFSSFIGKGMGLFFSSCVFFVVFLNTSSIISQFICSLSTKCLIISITEGTNWLKFFKYWFKSFFNFKFKRCCQSWKMVSKIKTSNNVCIFQIGLSYKHQSQRLLGIIKTAFQYHLMKIYIKQKKYYTFFPLLLFSIS